MLSPQGRAGMLACNRLSGSEATGDPHWQRVSTAAASAGTSEPEAWWLEEEVACGTRREVYGVLDAPS